MKKQAIATSEATAEKRSLRLAFLRLVAGLIEKETLVQVFSRPIRQIRVCIRRICVLKIAEIK